MTFRTRADSFASLCIFDACSGGSGSGTPSVPETASQSSNPPLLSSLGSATTQGSMGLQSLDLTFTYAGKANAVLVYEVGYTGKFTMASSCTTGPTVAARTRVAATATPTCQLTVTDSGNNTAVRFVGKTLATGSVA